MLNRITKETQSSLPASLHILTVNLHGTFRVLGMVLILVLWFRVYAYSLKCYRNRWYTKAETKSWKSKHLQWRWGKERREEEIIASWDFPLVALWVEWHPLLVPFISHFEEYLWFFSGAVIVLVWDISLCWIMPSPPWQVVNHSALCASIHLPLRERNKEE